MSLNSDQVSQQIDHMIKFIESEAREKAEEIRAKTEEEFNIEKARLVQEEKVKITNQFERKQKLVETQKKIENSNKLNKARLEILRAQDDHLKAVIDAAKEQSKNLSKDKAAYSKLVQDLITQSLCSLLETHADLKCRKSDVAIVKSAIPKAVDEYKKLTGMSCKININEEDFLDEECNGGVELSVNDNIKVTNTLDQRVNLAVDRLMPALRHQLFGASESRMFFD